MNVFYGVVAVAFASVGLSHGHLSWDRMPDDLLYATCSVVEGIEFPSLVSVEANGLHVCAGSILNSEWILTAKYCALWNQAYSLIVRVGSNKLHEGTPHKVEEIQRHPSTESELALFRVSPQIRMGKEVSAATLPEEGREPLKGIGTVAGWGSGPYWKASSEKLTKMDLRIMDTYFCNETFVKDGRKIHDSEFCAEYIQRLKPCTGDNGGPIYEDDVLLGVTVGKHRSLDFYVPEVFTKVSSSIRWIEKTAALDHFFA